MFSPLYEWNCISFKFKGILSLLNNLLIFWLCWVLGAQAFSSCSKQGLIWLWVAGFSLCGFSCCGAQALGCLGFGICATWALEHKLNRCGTQASLFLAWGIFLDQGSNPCLLRWQADSLPLSHQGRPGWLVCSVKYSSPLPTFLLFLTILLSSFFWALYSFRKFSWHVSSELLLTEFLTCAEHSLCTVS